MTRPTSLYRHFDATGRLLYVGIAMNALARQVQHVNGSHWADMIATITIERFPTRGAAVDAEERAIAVERPLYNLASRPAELEPEIDEAAEMKKLERYLERKGPAKC